MTDSKSNYKPSSIQAAIGCLWLSALLSVPVLALILSGVVDLPSRVSLKTIVIGVIGNFFNIWIIIGISNGKARARQLFALGPALALVLVPAFVLLLPASLALQTISQAFGTFWPLVSAILVAQLLLQIIALVLLFNSTSNRWFREQQLS